MQYNLVPANGRWCSAAGEVTAGQAESNGSLPPGLWVASVTCGLTAEISPGTRRSFRIWDYLYLIYGPGKDGRLSWPEWLVVYQGSGPSQHQSGSTWGNFTDRDQFTIAMPDLWTSIDFNWKKVSLIISHETAFNLTTRQRCNITIFPQNVLFPVSEMTYTVSSGTLNSTIPYHTPECLVLGVIFALHKMCCFLVFPCASAIIRWLSAKII